ncbi:type IV toxin-antitoxin system AbiEi family antitoxin domain-containing protein [Ancrocorticia sp.]|uniref:type IV toxin-antitoxin system AbiEi family antitoxin domain-containing protein n=1 Tax=Ancrocorticia sp. TaxID=2593684 RepID=UPI003F92ED48
MVSVAEKLFELSASGGGVLRTASAEANGVSRPSFMEFVHANRLERISPGVYAAPDTWVDEMYVLSLRSDRAVFSHESALLLHGLVEREPEALTVTLPSGYNASLLRRDGVRTFFIKPELLSLGCIEVLTPDGNTVASYDLERTICDLERSRSRIDQQTFTAALKGYVRRSDKRLDVLARYASQLGVERRLREYMKVLL